MTMKQRKKRTFAGWLVGVTGVGLLALAIYLFRNGLGGGFGEGAICFFASLMFYSWYRDGFVRPIVRVNISIPSVSMPYYEGTTVGDLRGLYRMYKLDVLVNGAKAGKRIVLKDGDNVEFVLPSRPRE